MSTLSDSDDDQWNEMSAADRIVQCRHKAKEAEQMAASAPVDYQRRFKEIAEQWLLIASDLETDALLPPR